VDWDDLSAGNIKSCLLDAVTPNPPSGGKGPLKLQPALLEPFSGDTSWHDGF
jgi:hypothetical protein